MTHSNRFTSFLCLLMVTALLALTPETGRADTLPVKYNTESVCTSFGERATEAFDPHAINPEEGLLSGVYTFITKTVNDSTRKLFQAFTGSSAYQNAVYWTITLMIIFYGVGFTIGVVQPSFQQALVRLVKIAFIFALISPTGWQFFSGTGPDDLGVVPFFQNGSDDLIKGVQKIGTGIDIPPGATPFYALDRIAKFVIQPDTLIAIMGSVFAGGPYGLTMGGLMIIAIWGLLQLILKTLRVYAITFVARALVLGVAPIFFIFLLFDRTKNMFVAWLNALINLSLQPILLFTFLSFFLVMIESAAKDMLGNELCWQDFKNIEGSTNKLAFWRFTDKTTGTASTGELTYQGALECLISSERGGKPCADFPINIVDLLSFLILVYLAQRFTEVVERISSELSNALVALDNAGRLDQMLASQNQRGTGPAVNRHDGGTLPTGKRRP